MNILEALKAVKDGKIIKTKIGEVYFILQSVLLPFEEKQIQKIDLNECAYKKNCPLSISDLHYEFLENICIEALDRRDYSMVTPEEMMEEIQNKWKENQG
jgi:hypothetical protein